MADDSKPKPKVSDDPEVETTKTVKVSVPGVADSDPECLWCGRPFSGVEFCQRCGFSPPAAE